MDNNSLSKNNYCHQNMIGILPIGIRSDFFFKIIVEDNNNSNNKNEIQTQMNNFQNGYINSDLFFIQNLIDPVFNKAYNHIIYSYDYSDFVSYTNYYFSQQ